MMMLSSSRSACAAAASSRMHTRIPALLHGLVPKKPASPSSKAPQSMQGKVNQVACQAAASGSSSGDHAGYAVLHDFCMTLPYGTLVGFAGVAALFLTSLKAVAYPLIGLGAATLLMAVLSLKGWKQGNSSTVFTLLSAGTAGGAAYLSYPHIQAGVTGWLAGAVTALSCAASLFCLYNVLAGGNPPRKGSK